MDLKAIINNQTNTRKTMKPYLTIFLFLTIAFMPTANAQIPGTQNFWNISTGVSGTANFDLPIDITVTSYDAENGGIGDIQGYVDNGSNQVVYTIPYTAGSGKYSAYTSPPITVVGEGGDTNTLTYSYPAGTFAASGNITATVTVAGADTTFDVAKTTEGVDDLFATFTFTINGTDRGNLTLTAIGSCVESVKISSTVEKNFLCHNLGADPSLDPHTPVVGLQGGYVQWGRRGPNTTGDATVDWQTAGNTSNFAAAPTSTNANAGSIAGWSTSAAGNRSWNSGTEAAPVKTANDPCPAGFRVPTRNEWTGVNTNNTISRTGPFTYSSTHYGSALHYGPDTSTKLLTLPAAGFRNTTNGTLDNRGTGGYYWSSTENSTRSHNLFFVSWSENPGSISSRPHGFSVRCIEE